MRIAQEVRDFGSKQDKGIGNSIATDPIATKTAAASKAATRGMEETGKLYCDAGRPLHVGADGP